MKPIWLIEAGVYGDEATPLLAEIRRQGMRAELLPYRSLIRREAAGFALPDAGGCVIGYGTYPFAQQILLHHQWTPGAWCSAQNLDCKTYYPHFGGWLLNHEHEMLPGVEAIRRRDELFERFAREGRVFVRPASCDKLFVGRCVSREDFAGALGPSRYDPATLVIVAAPKVIDREWRLIVVENRIVSGSRYAVDGSKSVEAGLPAEVAAFATAVLSEVHWRPEPVFMFDVGESDGGFHIVELNSFSGSWLYGCDLAEVVAAASNAAEQQWKSST